MKRQDYYITHQSEFKDYRSVGGEERLSKSVNAVLEDSPKVILDVGCGDGNITKHFLKDDNLVVGLEINKQSAIEAKPVDVILCDAETKWPIRNGSADAIYMGALLEHVFDYDFVLGEARRVLKKDGSLVILIPNGVNLKDRLKMLLGKQPDWYKIKGHIRFWTLPYLRKTLVEHEFKEKYVYAIPFPTKEWLYRLRLLNPIYAYLERRFSFGKLLLWKGYKEVNNESTNILHSALQ